MKKSNEIQLDGLTGSSPLGALAAYGLLKVCSEIDALSQARLAWRLQDDWLAVISLPDEIEPDELIRLLGDYFKDQKTDVFDWANDVRVDNQVYRQLLLDTLETTDYTNRGNCDYLAVLASEMSVDNSKGLVKPTRFYMTSGQMSFLGSAKAVVESFHKDQPEKIREALYGPWLYRDKQHALGWDPAAERLYALRHKKPGEESPTSVIAAVRLALEAISLYPVFPDKNGQLQTGGFIRKNQENVFRWPLWGSSIGLDSLKTLLLSNLDDAETLVSRGVTAVYSSVRSEYGQGYGIFRPAQMQWQKHRR